MTDFVIQLDERWRIRRYDSRNFVIEYYQRGGVNPKTKKQAPDRWDIKAYQSSLGGAIAALPSHLPFDPRIKDFATLRLQMEAIASRLDSCADEIVSEMEKSVKALAEQLAGRMQA